jgi:hypothetical protein
MPLPLPQLDLDGWGQSQNKCHVSPQLKQFLVSLILVDAKTGCGGGNSFSFFYFYLVSSCAIADIASSRLGRVG